ncbi:alpha/beta fold hydrolase [Tunturiibacter gelidoferens]|uniref:Alpha-beta hydrolase superfamily lysophospholipase n=2 Tax=Tunturiibacter TaxID=3154218 RepID=A0A7Y9NQ59_9BACT|nr:alpha-beta hydrolase superfamily lysophospholipase [Edaphobacter lichenicola]NYF53521.1 alpha-beta hydrolase superfamily lysophospholipase [Edaphobacter lichenicola]
MNASDEPLLTSFATAEVTPSRRSFLLSSPAILASGLAILEESSLHSARASAQQPSQPAIWSREYWARRGDIKLYLFRKNAGSASSGHSTRPILFLCHGSSVSSRPTFDLTVPGHGEYSLMDKFVEFGFDVWTMDFEGYGRSSPSAGNSNVADGVEDLKAASLVVQLETGQPSFHLYGESGGALRAGAFAVAQPASVRRLVLAAFTWTGKGSSTLTKRAESLDSYRTHNLRPRDRDAIRSIFTRDKPGTSDPAVAEAMADAELKFGDSAPTGTYLDMSANLPLVDPTKLRAPVLIVRGEYDGIATEEDLLNFFRSLPVPDREFIILPGAAHSVALGTNRSQLWHTMRAFLDMPTRLDQRPAPPTSGL